MAPDAAVSTAAEFLAVAELARAESVQDISECLARHAGEIAGALAARVWTLDATRPNFVSTGAWGRGIPRAVRKSAPREAGIIHELIRDRRVLQLDAGRLLAQDDPLLAGGPAESTAAVIVPLQSSNAVTGALVLFFAASLTAEQAPRRLSALLPSAEAALARSLDSFRRNNGMLYAIERLTNLYDLSRAFGSTLDMDELSAIIAHKAADFTSGEAASLWTLDGDEGEVLLAATAVNENYEILNPPESVGAGSVAEIIATQTPLLQNGLEEEGMRSLLAIPLIEGESPAGALVVVNKRGRNPEFSEADLELLTDLGHQAVRALRNARRYAAEQRVEELDALLAVSREITATLDLDRVMNSIVNASSALITYDRCSLALMSRGKLQVGAVSGIAKLDRSDENIRRLAPILEWVFYGGSDITITQDEDDRIETERPETEEKFRNYFSETGMHSFIGLMLKDEEGKLGVLAFENTGAIVPDQDSLDLLQILVNQATVALRNAQLYQQVPLAGFWKPLLEKKRRLASIPKTKLRLWGAIAVAVILLLTFVPWNIRLAGTARILAAQRITVTAPVSGIISAVGHREGDVVRRGDVLASLRNQEYLAALAAAQSAYDIARAEAARDQAQGNAAGMAAAMARSQEAAAQVNLARTNLQNTDIRAPEDGVILTPHLTEKIGQPLAAGEALCQIANTTTVRAEVAIPEADSELVKIEDPVALKINTYPTRVFHGKIDHIGAAIREEGNGSFLVVETEMENPGGLLRFGMLGRGKVATGARRLGYAVFRRPLRYFWLKLWPKLP